MDSDSIIEEWTKRGIKYLFQIEDKVLRSYTSGDFLLRRSIIKKSIEWGTPMFHKDNPEYNRRQVGLYTLDELVPKDHF